MYHRECFISYISAFLPCLRKMNIFQTCSDPLWRKKEKLPNDFLNPLTRACSFSTCCSCIRICLTKRYHSQSVPHQASYIRTTSPYFWDHRTLTLDNTAELHIHSTTYILTPFCSLYVNFATYRFGICDPRRRCTQFYIFRVDKI